MIDKYNKVSLQKDFQDGDVLYSHNLNNNFTLIEKAINENENNLNDIVDNANAQINKIIEDANKQIDNIIVKADTDLNKIVSSSEAKLKKELAAITANRGWDWNSGERVIFTKGNKELIKSIAIRNGQTLVNTITGESYLDTDGKRVMTSQGEAFVISKEDPKAIGNKAIKFWIDPSKFLGIQSAMKNQVVDTLSGTQRDMAPSVRVVKDSLATKFDKNKIKSGTSSPSGGQDGDIYFKYE